MRTRMDRFTGMSAARYDAGAQFVVCRVVACNHVFRVAANPRRATRGCKQPPYLLCLTIIGIPIAIMALPGLYRIIEETEDSS